MKQTICLDFDGVCHQYVTPWEAADVIPDKAVPGLFEFIEQASEKFEIAVHSARCKTVQGRDAMLEWFEAEYLEWATLNARPPKPLPIKIVEHKPAAVIYIDDRGWRFEGTFPKVEDLPLTTWYKNEV